VRAQSPTAGRDEVNQEGVARVVLLPAVGGLGELDYRVPPALRRADLVGCRVLLPLGNRRVAGVVCELVGAPAREKLKDVEAVLDDVPVLDLPLLDLCRWMADYYLVPLAEAVATALPAPLRIETERAASLTDAFPETANASERERELIAALRPGRQTVGALARKLRLAPAELNRRLQALRRKGWVEVSETLREHAPTKHLRFYQAVARPGAAAELKRRPALAALYGYLREHPLRRASARELRDSFPNAAAKLRALTAAGLARCHEEEVYRTVSGPPPPDRSVTPTEDQRQALAAIAETAGFAPFLLWGVTGSGKTEVYLRAVAEVLRRNQTALVLVPRSR